MAPSFIRETRSTICPPLNLHGLGNHGSSHQHLTLSGHTGTSGRPRGNKPPRPLVKHTSRQEDILLQLQCQRVWNLLSNQGKKIEFEVSLSHTEGFLGNSLVPRDLHMGLQKKRQPSVTVEAPVIAVHISVFITEIV